MLNDQPDAESQGLLSLKDHFFFCFLTESHSKKVIIFKEVSLGQHLKKGPLNLVKFFLKTSCRNFDFVSRWQWKISENFRVFISGFAFI